MDQEISLDEFLGTSQSPTTSSCTSDASQRVSIDLELFLQEGETNTYSGEFKHDVVQRVVKDQFSPKEVGKEFGVSAHTVRDWVKRSGNQLPKVYKKMSHDCGKKNGSVKPCAISNTTGLTEGEGEESRKEEDNATVIVVAKEDSTVLVFCSYCGSLTHSDHLFVCQRCKRALSKGVKATTNSQHGRS